MKITIWQPKVPATVGEMKDDFAHRLGAFRAATGRPERFVTRCACAVHDKGFTVVYERTDPAQAFIITDIYKDGEDDAPSSAGATRHRTLPAAEADNTGWACPYCGNEHQIGCHQCHTTVCGGKTRGYPGTGDIFTCRGSCGARGTLVVAPTVKGIEPARNLLGRKPAPERLSGQRVGTLRLGMTKTPPGLK